MVRLEGRGLFTGAPAAVTLAPSTQGLCVEVGPSGVRGSAILAAVMGPDTPGAPRELLGRNTSLLVSGRPALTVEHVLSALAGLGVTDATVRLESAEVPMFDGSSKPFVEALERAELVETVHAPEAIVLTGPVVVEDGRGGRLEARPRRQAGSRYEYQLDYGTRSALGRQVARWESGLSESGSRYTTEIAPARTFCLRSEAEAMRAAGKFLDLSPRDMLVIDDATGRPVDNEFRFEDEPARHKLLDLIGDLSLLGRPLQAEVRAERSGHALTQALCRAIVAQIRG